MAKKKCSICVLAKLIFVVLLFGVVVQMSWNYLINTPIDFNDDKKISFVVNKGEFVSDVAENLKEKGLIRSEIAFKLYAKMNDLEDKIKAGRFDLMKNQNVPEIFDTLTNLNIAEIAITILEGDSVKDIDMRLIEKQLIEMDEFEKAVKEFNDYDKYDFLDKDSISDLKFPLEGYLYPDTYFIDTTDFNSNDLIYKMLDNFENKIEEYEAEINENKYSMHQIITMASILQKEVRTQKDLPVVAGILWKRYENNWHIGADATIIYETRSGMITYEDLQIDSPYNTRKNIGLPPGPIGNPELKYIEATLNPEDSEYWYYLTTLDTGEVIYAKTNDEHNVNKEKYLKM